jgi:regulator of cell morphogenesis and NO signaling
MFLQTADIQKNSTVNDIVSHDHRTADVFRKYGIEYCCGGRWPLETVCMMKGLEFEQLKDELGKVSRTLQVSPLLAYDTWNLDFLINYIVNVHHYYLRSTLPSLGELMREFSEEHRSKYPNMVLACDLFQELQEDMLPHLNREEEVIFPYICRLMHAYANSDTYAKLLVKTLRKPLEVTMQKDTEMISNFIYRLRELTNEYVPPEKACVSHRVVFSKLKELDNDLNQHVYLESEILFPRALAMEKELLSL